MANIEIDLDLKLKLLLAALMLLVSNAGFTQEIQYGVRPYFLIDAMQDGPLKSKLNYDLIVIPPMNNLEERLRAYRRFLVFANIDLVRQIIAFL